MHACFLLYLIHAFLFTIRTYVGTPEATYYLQRPLETLLIIAFELGRSPLFFLTLLQLMISALVLGFITDWIYGLLRKHLSKNKTRNSNN
jgi:hypothetical protein